MLWTLGEDPYSLLRILVGLVALAGLVTLFARAPRLAVVLILVPPLLYAMSVPRFVFPVGVTNIYPVDLIGVAALIVVGKRLLERRQRLPGAAVPFLLFLCLAATLALIGAAQFSVNTAFNEFRGVLEPLPVLLLVAMSFRTEADVDWLVRVWVWFGVVLSGVAVMHWARYGLGSSSTMIVINGEVATGRGLPASGALAIVTAALLLGYSGRPAQWSAARRRLVMVWLLAIAVLLQHRSVWVVLAVSLLVGTVLERNGRGHRVAASVGGLYLGAVAGLGLLLHGGTVSQHLSASWQAAFAQSSTVTWRVTSWGDLLQQQLSSVQQWLFGRPFGYGYLRVIDGEIWTVMPHNFYVQVLLRGGVIGLVVLLAGYLLMWRALGDLSVTSDVELGVGLRLVLAAQAVYFIPYQLPMEQGLLLGLCVVAPAALVSSRRRVARLGRGPTPALYPEAPAGPDHARNQRASLH